MTKKELLEDFLNWVFKQPPMKLETDHDDIVLMYLQEKNLPVTETCKECEGRGFRPAVTSFINQYCQTCNGTGEIKI